MMKIYYGVPASNKSFPLEENQYEEFKNDFYNKKNIAIKYENNYIKLIKNTNSSSCATCFFYKICNNFLTKGISFECCAYKILGEDNWRDYEFKKIDEYEAVFG